VTPPERAARVERILTDLGLATAPLPYPLAAVLDALATDKKHAGGDLRWVLPTADGYEVHADVPMELVERVATGLLAPVGAGSGGRS
jgi:3-dehydroquinate synthetase